MQYMLLIYGQEPTGQPTPEEMQAEIEAYNAFTEECRSRGILGPAEALQPAATATSIRVRDGKTLTTDGPFAETKEILGGFYILNCKDVDEAIEMAAKIPSATNGTIEIRPIVDFSQM